MRFEILPVYLDLVWESERRRLRFRNKWRRVGTSVARWDDTDHKHYYHQVSYHD